MTKEVKEGEEGAALAVTPDNSKATVAQINAWKKQYGDIFEIAVEGHTGYIRKPGRKDLAHATLVGKKDPFKFNETILNNCWVGGDEAIKTNDDLFLSACAVLGEIIEIKEAEIKKL